MCVRLTVLWSEFNRLAVYSISTQTPYNISLISHNINTGWPAGQ